MDAVHLTASGHCRAAGLRFRCSGKVLGDGLWWVVAMGAVLVCTGEAVGAGRVEDRAIGRHRPARSGGRRPALSAHLVMDALVADDIAIAEADMVEDGRRVR